jgi:hypothetical protein
MRYWFTMFFWFLFTSYGLITTFGIKPLPCTITGYISFFLGLTFMGMLWDLKDVVESNKKAKKIFREKRSG